MEDEIPTIDFGTAGFEGAYDSALGQLAAGQTGLIYNILGFDPDGFDLAQDDFAGNGANDAWLKVEAMLEAAGFGDMADELLGRRDEQAEAAARNILSQYWNFIQDGFDFLNALPDNNADFQALDHDFSNGNLWARIAENVEFMLAGITETLDQGNIYYAIEGIFIGVFHSASQTISWVLDGISSLVTNIAAALSGLWSRMTGNNNGGGGGVGFDDYYDQFNNDPYQFYNYYDYYDVWTDDVYCYIYDYQDYYDYYDSWYWYEYDDGWS